MNIKKLIPILAIFLVFGASANAQTSLTQTTLIAALSGGAYGSVGASVNSPLQTTFALGSVTGIQGLGSGSFGASQFNTAIYIDHELMYVVSVNTTASTVTVLRAQGGTAATGHIAGRMVLYGPLNAFSPSYVGLFNGPYGSCNSTGILFTPYVDVPTGNQWICSPPTTGTGTWIPGWYNTFEGQGQGATVASAASAITPSAPYFNISGTSAITGFNIPVGFDPTQGGCFTANPTGIWTWTAAGNIATAGTVTAASTPVTFCWNVLSQKWIPSRLS